MSKQECATFPPLLLLSAFQPWISLSHLNSTDKEGEPAGHQQAVTHYQGKERSLTSKLQLVRKQLQDRNNLVA